MFLDPSMLAMAHRLIHPKDYSSGRLYSYDFHSSTGSASIKAKGICETKNK
jgi:hypothetical protein